MMLTMIKQWYLKVPGRRSVTEKALIRRKEKLMMKVRK